MNEDNLFIELFPCVTLHVKGFTTALHNAEMSHYEAGLIPPLVHEVEAEEGEATCSGHRGPI